jgi:hypothetical protein
MKTVCFEIKVMILKNKLDKSFGPSGTFAGYTILVLGIAATWSTWGGLLLVIVGAFMGFSSTGTVIDTDKKKIRYLNNLFGFIPAGKEIDIDKSMKLGIKESNITWTTFSQSNRSINTLKNDFRIVLCDSGEKEIMEISKSDSFATVKDHLDALSRQLGLEVI